MAFSLNNVWTMFDLIRGRSARAGNRSQFGYLFTNTSGYTEAGRSVDTDSLLENATVLTGVNAISKGISQIPYQVKRMDESGTLTAVPDHPIQAILNKPNVFQTPSEFKSSIVTDLIVYGNAWIKIIKVGDRVAQLVPLNPDDMSIGSNGLGIPTYNHTEFGDIPGDEIIHLRDIVTHLPQGSSRLLLAAERIGALKAADGLIAQTFRNGINVNYAVTSPAAIEADAAEAFSKQMAEKFGQTVDKRNSGAILLGNGASIQQLKGSTPADADLRALRQDLIREIAACLGVPSAMLGVGDQDKYNNVRQKLTSFMRDSLNPILVLISEAFKVKLLSDEDYICFNSTHFIAGAVNEQADYVNGLVSNGVITPNEARDFLGYNPAEDEFADNLIPPNSTTNTNVEDPEATGGEDGPQGGEERPERVGDEADGES